jgi:hypothetical protein
VRIRHSGGCATVTVTDDGVGGADPTGGSGLRGLAARVEALGGRVDVDSPRGQGTRIEAEIPDPEPGSSGRQNWRPGVERRRSPRASPAHDLAPRPPAGRSG